eukprot:TRINITY_DN4845_c0_g1_i3.p1 TRINITY_DN4845_c0_g1~~TRINITY_DN4845_c0_g1_i3.p1  ORF type:complete len:1069 (-),score=250.89 TRINITY_DN4845_c0_g1_i3:1-3207(-)
MINLEDGGGFSVTSHQLVELVEKRKDGAAALKEYGGALGLAEKLNVDPNKGLNPDNHHDMKARIEAFGASKFKDKPPKSYWVFLWNAATDKILILLSIAAVVSIVLEAVWGEQLAWIEGVAILIAVVVISLVTSLNDWSKDRQFRKLSAKEQDKQVKIHRGGSPVKISIYDLLVGDIVYLEAGDAIFADGVVIKAHSLACDESQMTGEPHPIRKGDKDPFIVSGCKVGEGSGKMLVIAVGSNCQWGKLKALLVKDEEPETPLQEKLDKLADLIGLMGLTVAVSIFLILLSKWAIEDYAVSKEKWDWHDLEKVIKYVVISITVVVVAVPEGLPLAVALSLAYSMHKMMKDQNFVRHLAACETMGGATQICSDKTGTLTQNRMTVVRSWIAGKDFDYQDGVDASTLGDKVRTVLCDSISVNTTADIEKKSSGLPEFIGNQTECALLAFAEKLGANYRELRSGANVVHLFPFSSSKKRMSTLITSGDGYRLYCKGASEVVLGMCKTFINQKGESEPLVPENITYLNSIIEDYARKEGLRTLTLAYRELPSSLSKEGLEPAEDLEDPGNFAPLDEDLTLIALVGIEDPLRPEVVNSVIQCKRAGIQVRMLTGDNILTAKTIAKRAGIYTEEGLAMEGPKFRTLSDEQLNKCVPILQVVARCSPEDKFVLVKKLKSLGEVVAVTGDGTNDAPQLLEADVGFAMGICGTEVAKSASDIILLDDNFASIVKAVMWGRNVFDCIRKFVQFQLTVNVVAVVTVFVGGILDGEDPPLKAIQLLWVNLIMDTMAALALATEVPTEGLLDRPPHGRNANLITFKMWRFILGHAMYQLIAVFLILELSQKIAWLEVSKSKDPKKTVNTLVFNSFVLCQLFNEFNARKLGNEINVFQNLHKNWIFNGVIIFSVVVQILIVQFGGAAMQTVALNWPQWGFCVLVGFVELPYGLILKLIPVPAEKPHKSITPIGDETQPLLLEEKPEGVDEYRKSFRKSIRRSMRKSLRKSRSSGISDYQRSSRRMSSRSSRRLSTVVPQDFDESVQVDEDDDRMMDKKDRRKSIPNLLRRRKSNPDRISEDTY